MADNLTTTTTVSTVPASTVIATDDVGGVHYERVKITDGTADSSTPINAGHGVAANALRVELPTDGTGVIATVGAVTAITNALPAGTNNIGDVDVLTVPAPLSTTGNGTAAAALRVSVASDSTGQIALAAGAATIGALTANQSVNVAQINGVTTTMGNGVAGTGVQRVTLASDSTGQVALAAGAATIGSLAANQSTNIAQMNGVATTMGNGVSGTGVQRVTLASDSTGQVALAAGAATIGALTANQSVNVAQINGVAATMGNGASGTGVQRVTIASDSTGILATVSTVTTVSTLTGGGVAHDGADSGNPIKVGARARTSETAAVANDDRADAIADKVGKRIVLPYSLPENFVSGVSSTTGTGDTSTIASAGGSLRTYLTSCSFANSSATATIVEIKDGSTVKWRTMVAAGGGSNHTFTTPLVGTAATAWNIAALTGVTTLYASLAGYTGL